MRSVIVILCVISVCLLSGCSRPQANVIVLGSTSVEPYAGKLAEIYAHIHPDREIDVQGGGSGVGIAAVESGIADIGMSSRALKEEEKEFIGWEKEIAKDGLAIIVHPDNPVSDLTLEEIRGIYTMEVTNWSQLPGGDDAPIHIITREEGSGTRSAFEELVMGKGVWITQKAMVQSSNGAVRQIVSGDKNAIGFISLGLVEIGEKPVKALALNGVAATRENIENGSYELSRPFLFVALTEPDGPAKQFVEYVLSPEGQQILIAEGFIRGADAAP
ncbi:MAG: phosphate ABC transporter substrate-binding protein [Oscillospiraceae bacterium]|nr:phosphate ABC transporter substrate-binding protein [Oscillospiraceae bacterium]